MEWCKCMGVKSFRGGLSDLFSFKKIDNKIVGEFWELFASKNFVELKDEFSDVAWGIGRILGGIQKKPYVRIFGDKLHYEKVAKRMIEYGCVRSKRFLVNGKCPSL